MPIGLRGRVVGVTKGDSRYDGILCYVQEEKPSAYIILDDMNDEFPQSCPELLLCDSKSGVSDKGIQAALIEFLTSNSQPFLLANQ